MILLLTDSWLFFGFYVIVNAITFFAMGYDKQLAKMKKWRISEKTFLIFSIFGGGLGGLMGMLTFRHKTKHMYFYIMYWISIIVYGGLMFLYGM